MATYIIRFDGSDGQELQTEDVSLEQARNRAIGVLGEYLQENPQYAYERHWRVDLLDPSRRLLLHVIVATVEAAKPLNRASFEGWDGYQSQAAE